MKRYILYLQIRDRHSNETETVPLLETDSTNEAMKAITALFLCALRSFPKGGDKK